MEFSIQLKIAIQLVLFSVSFFTAKEVAAQGTRSDYERAFNLRKITANKVYKQRVTAHWFAGSKQFWYRNDLADEKIEFILVNAETGTRRPAFDHERLAAVLAKATGEEIQADRLPIDKLEFSESGSELRFTCQGKRWKCDLSSYEVREVPKDEQTTSILQPQTEVRPSTRSGEETSITFINHTKNAVELYWVDSERQRRHYATIKAGEQHEQHTFAGHVWLVTDEDEKPLAIFVATEEAAEAVIDEDVIEKAALKDKPKRPRRRGRSPDGKWFAFVKDYNLSLLSHYKSNNNNWL